MRTSFKTMIIAGTVLLSCLLFPPQPAVAGVQIMPLPPGSGVTFGQVDWPALPQPAMDTGTGVMEIDMARVRQVTGRESGYINAEINGSWAVRNTPVFSTNDFPYPQTANFFNLGVETGTDVNELQAKVVFSTDLVLNDSVFVVEPTFFTYEVTPEPVVFGGLPAPMVAPPPPPVDAVIPQPALDHASVQVIQRGHPNVNAARNQCMPMAIANSLQYLENTTDLELPQSHVPGLAPNGNSDGTLVGDIEAETSRAPSVISRTNQGATGTWGLNGKLKFLAKNGLGDDVQTRHFGHYPYSPNGDFTTNPITESAGGNSATSMPFGKTVSIADLVNSLRDGQDCEVVYTYPNGGSHAVELVAAGISGGLPWTVTASDLRQTDQSDPTDTNLGAGQGFEFSYMSDIDGDGFLEFPDRRELVTAYCEKYVGEPAPPPTPPPPPSTTTTEHEVVITQTQDPAGHSCCVQEPGSIWKWFFAAFGKGSNIPRGANIRIESTGDGFPLEGTIDENGHFEASSISNVAGFPNVETLLVGDFNADDSADAQLAIGTNGALPTGAPIVYTLEISPPINGKAGDKVVVEKGAVSTQGEIRDIPPGDTLTIATGDTMTLQGLLNNQGSVVIEAGATLVNNGLLNNQGSLTIHGTLNGAGLFGNSGEIVNDGTVAMTGTTHLTQRGSVENTGTWKVVKDSLLVNAGLFDNRGQLVVSGRLTNQGTLEGNRSLRVKSGGLLANHNLLQARVNNAGRLINVCDASITGPVSGNPPQAFCRLRSALSGLQEAPVVQTTALGEAQFQLDVATPALDYSVALPDLSLANVIAVEIRRGGFFDNGPVVFTILGPNGGEADLVTNHGTGMLTGRWDATDTGPFTQTLVNQLLDGALYLQVRTQAHPNGELRGQIIATGDTQDGTANGTPIPGLLYDRAKDGHGLDLQKAGGNYVVTLYTHAEDASPEWYQLVAKLANGVLQGDLLHYTYDSADSPPQTGVVAGDASLAFGVDSGVAACNDGVDRSNAVQLVAFAWTINGESGTWCLEPLIVGGAGPAPNFTGLWYAGASDTGWGISILQQGDVLVAILFFYDADGNPRWVLGSTQNFNNGDSLDMLEYTGYCRACPFFRETVKAGTLTLNFTTPSQSPTGNTVTVDVTYQGPEGGGWKRDDVEIKLLSDPAS